jgi:hypothetical protein
VKDKDESDSGSDKEEKLSDNLIIQNPSESPNDSINDEPVIKLYLPKSTDTNTSSESKRPSKSSLKKSSGKKRHCKVRFVEGAQVKHIRREGADSDEELNVQPLVTLAEAQVEFPFIDSGESDSDSSSEEEGKVYEVREPKLARRLEEKHESLGEIDEEEEEFMS